MLCIVTLLRTLEDYYDAAPRPLATTEEVGPFALFLRAGDDWPYYARPRLAHHGPASAGPSGRWWPRSAPGSPAPTSPSRAPLEISHS
jgi:hypothetical protein